MTTPRAMGAREVSAVIGLLAVVDGAARSGKLPLDLSLRLRQRLVRAGVMAGARRPGDLAATLDDLVQQVRMLEDEEGHQDLALEHLPLVNVVAFAGEESARSFVEQMRQLGRDVDAAVHEPAHRRWVVAIHTQQRDIGEATVGQDVVAAHERGGWHLGAF